MRQGTIERAARSDNRFMVWASALLVAACVVILAIHARYIYNWVAGPFAVDASLLDDPGWRRFVRITGELEHSGVVEETSKRLGRYVEVSREETAEFFTVQIVGRPLLVKVPRDFAGNVVAGRLVETPERLRTLLGADKRVYGWMIDAEHSFRGDWNVPLVLAILLFVPSVWWLTRAARRARSYMHHSQIAALSAHGEPRDVIDQIEREMRDLGDAAHVGPYWISSSWLVKPEPLLMIVHARDVIGVARRTRKVKNGEKHEVLLWRRGQAMDETAMAASETEAVAQRVTTCIPWAAVADPDTFSRLWKEDRAAQEAAASVRYDARVDRSHGPT
jgi:hypothetical protein